MQALLTSPDYDKVTLYLKAWSKKLVRSFKSNVVFHILDKKNVNRKNFESFLEKKSFDVVLLNGHGANDRLAGEDGEIILDSDNISLLKGKSVHALSCQTAKKLGPAAMEAGAKAYIGYDEDFVFVNDDSKLTRPEEDETAALFLDPAFTAPKALLNQKTANEAYCLAIKEYDRSIMKAFNSDVQSDNDQFIRYLIADRNHLVARE